MSKLIINNESLRIRPSAVDTFYGCAWQWAKSHLEGARSMPNSRASIGTAIHKGVEASWIDAMAAGKADHNKSMMADAAIMEWQEEIKDGVHFGNAETKGTCEREIVKGLDAWVEDISPFVAIPKAVEVFYTIPIDHPMVTEVGGTIDYLADGVIDDVKTSKRKVSPGGYLTQQSIYKMLAEANGEVINYSRIQCVVLKANPDGHILPLEPDVDKAKNLVNGILDVLDIVHKDIVPVELLLRGNPKYMFCSEAYCAHYATCPWVQGKVKPARKADIAAIKL